MQALPSNTVAEASSPGTITGVITLAAAHRTELLPISSIVAIALATAITCASLVLASLFGKSGHSPSLAQETLSRFMGLIVLAMGVQFALTGYRQFMAG